MGQRRETKQAGSELTKRFANGDASVVGALLFETSNNIEDRY